MLFFVILILAVFINGNQCIKLLQKDNNLMTAQRKLYLIFENKYPDIDDIYNLKDKVYNLYTLLFAIFVFLIPLGGYLMLKNIIKS